MFELVLHHCLAIKNAILLWQYDRIYIFQTKLTVFYAFVFPKTTN